MAYLLNLETTTTNCSVSITKNGDTVALKEHNDSGYSHAELLHVFIEDVLKEAGIQSTQLAAVAVSMGPGSYTGLRIGVSAAKGLCFALGIPLIAVSTLEALAHQVTATTGVIVPLLDARRMEVYAAVFNAQYRKVRAIKAEVIDPQSFNEYLNQDLVHFVGNGVAKCKTVIKHSNAVFVDHKLPSAAQMGALAYHKYKISDIEDVAYFEPFYLKDFVALKPKH